MANRKSKGLSIPHFRIPFQSILK